MLPLAVMLCAPASASALETVGSFEVELVVPDETGGWDPLVGDDLDEFFNIAACSCLADPQLGLEIRMTTMPDASLQDEKLTIFAGTSCNVTMGGQQDDFCEPLIIGDAPVLSTLFNRQTVVELDVRALMYPATPRTCACAEQDITTTVWILVDKGNDGTFEIDEQLTTSFDIDTDPPPQVLDLAADGVEDGVNLSWTVPDPSTDIAAYQVLCRSASDGRPLRMDEGHEAEYRAPVAICGVTTPPDTCAAPLPADAGVADAAPPDAAPPDAAPPDASPVGMDAGPDAAPVTPPVAGWNELGAAFLCSGRIAPENNEFRVELGGATLAQGEAVEVVLVVIDDHRNATVMPSLTATPAPVVDFWETYEDAGGDAKGGHCFVATAAYGDYDAPSVQVLRDFRDGTLARTEQGRDFVRWYYQVSPPIADWLRRTPGARTAARALLVPFVLGAGMWQHGVTPRLPAALALAALLVLGARRMWGLSATRRAVAAAAAGAALVLVLSGVASAQGIPVDRAEDWETAEDGLGAREHSVWAFELKFGPYYPEIDEEPGLAYAPYQTMFGDESSLLSQIELDRYFLFPRGQLGVGVTIGYMQNTANAFMQAADGSPLLDMRSPDETSFHLLPTSLSAIYRFTMLADETPVPLVPYAKVGLAYYFWWINKGNGDTSSTPEKGDASGGTLGWQASFGISFRLDMLDPEASQDMRTEFNVDHIGLFFEGTYADVTGLGMEKKLRVGDLFWSAGLNFEF